MTTHRNLFTLFLTLLLNFSAACGVSLADDVCEKECACGFCSDAEFRSCVAKSEAYVASVEAAGCGELGSAALACFVEHGTCDSGALVSSSCGGVLDSVTRCGKR